MEDSSSTRKMPLLKGWNAVPNLITYVRIVMVIVFITLAAQAGSLGVSDYAKRWTAAVLFIVAASTDKLDCYFARKYHQVTELGKLMDPIADKLLICSALITLSAFGELWWWVTVLFLIREIGITVMRFFIIDNGGKVIAANRAGKYKTVAECIGIGMLLLPVWLVPGIPSVAAKAYRIAGLVITLIALALCLYSGVMYVIGVFRPRSRQ